MDVLRLEAQLLSGKMIPEKINDDLARNIRGANYIANSVVGLSYEVPCLKSGLTGYALPIIPLIHDDLEIGFNDLHVHYDFRFFYEFELKEMLKDYHPLYKRKNNRFALVLPLKALKPEDLIVENRYCRRKSGIPTDSLCSTVHVGNLNLLEDQEKNRKKISCGVCPHKGHKFDSNSIRGEGDGATLHCPLHGLKFQIKTGRLLRCHSNVKNLNLE